MQNNSHRLWTGSQIALSFKCRKLSEKEAQILMQEIKNLSAEIIDCSAGEWLDHLMEKQSFTLWWD